MLMELVTDMCYLINSTFIGRYEVH